MNAPVNVLAVLDEFALYVRNVSSRHALQGDILEARATVAELIAAAKMANGDHSAPHDCYATGPLTGDPVMDLVVCPGCRLAAALARIGGAS